VFKYDPPSDTNTHPHSVYLLPNLWSFLKCDLSRAKLVASETQGGGDGFEFVLKSWQPHYFACGGGAGFHCNNGTMKFFVMPMFRRRYWMEIDHPLIACITTRVVFFFFSFLILIWDLWDLNKIRTVVNMMIYIGMMMNWKGYSFVYFVLAPLSLVYSKLSLLFILKGRDHNLYIAKFTIMFLGGRSFFTQLNLFSIADNPIVILFVIFRYCLNLTSYWS